MVTMRSPSNPKKFRRIQQEFFMNVHNGLISGDSENQNGSDRGPSLVDERFVLPVSFRNIIIS